MGRGLSDLQKQILILANGYRKANDWDVADFKDDGSLVLPWKQPVTGYYCCSSWLRWEDESAEIPFDEYCRKLATVYGYEPIQYNSRYVFAPIMGMRRGYYASYFRSQRLNTLEDYEQMKERFKAEFEDTMCDLRTHQGLQDDTVHLTPAHVLHEIFGFPVKKQPGLSFDEDVKVEHFDPDAIGRAKYNSAKVSTARAFDRLNERKLIVRGYSYSTRKSGPIWITRAGADLAESLSVNMTDNILDVNR